MANRQMIRLEKQIETKKSLSIFADLLCFLSIVVGSFRVYEKERWCQEPLTHIFAKQFDMGVVTMLAKQFDPTLRTFLHCRAVFPVSLAGENMQYGKDQEYQLYKSVFQGISALLNLHQNLTQMVAALPDGKILCLKNPREEKAMITSHHSRNNMPKMLRFDKCLIYEMQCDPKTLFSNASKIDIDLNATQLLNAAIYPNVALCLCFAEPLESFEISDAHLQICGEL